MYEILNRKDVSYMKITEYTTINQSQISSNHKIIVSDNNKTSAILPKDFQNAMINFLEEEDSIPQDNDFIVAQYAGGGTSNKTYKRRKLMIIFEYFKEKLFALDKFKNYIEPTYKLVSVSYPIANVYIPIKKNNNGINPNGFVITVYPIPIDDWEFDNTGLQSTIIIPNENIQPIILEEVNKSMTSQSTIYKIVLQWRGFNSDILIAISCGPYSDGTKFVIKVQPFYT